MNFLTRLIIVMLWLIGTSASALAVNKGCAKKESVISAQKISQHPGTSSPASGHAAILCDSSPTVYYNADGRSFLLIVVCNRLKYPGYIFQTTLQGYHVLLYSPPRLLLHS